MTAWHRHRTRWAAIRDALEKKPVKKGVFEGHGIKMDTLSRMAGACLRGTPLYARGFKNAAFPRLVHRRIVFDNLPRAFDGYTILHLTDLHLGSVPGLVERTCELIRNTFKGAGFDACLMTGDYIDRHIRAHYLSVMEAMGAICSAMSPRDGIFAVLGNHDTWRMAAPMEAMGIRVLTNEAWHLRRQSEGLCLIGLDDPNHYATLEAVQTLAKGGNGFKIAMVHTPEFFRDAEESGVDFYLTGHTHGGQICLPGGRPVVLPLKRGKQFYKGLWQYGRMTGYTGQGLGTISVPLRFNTFSEVTLIELRRKARNEGRDHD